VGGGFEFDSDQKTGSDIASMQKNGTSKKCHLLRQPNIGDPKRLIVKL
jgi:hypothetical protein